VFLQTVRGGADHRCFVQRALSPQEIKEEKREKKRKRQGGRPAKRRAASGLQTLQANEEEERVGDEGDNVLPLFLALCAAGFLELSAMRMVPKFQFYGK